MTHLDPDCPRCEGAGILNVGTDSEGNEKIFYCPACDGRGTRDGLSEGTMPLSEPSNPGKCSESPASRPLAESEPFDQRWNAMERASEEALRRAEQC